MFAAFRFGAIFVPVNFRLAGPELQAVLQGSGATAIVCEDGHRDTLDAVRDQTELKHFLLIDDDPEIPATPEPVKDWQPWSPVLAAAEPPTTLVPRGFDDPAILMFTSGTTGQPKGVIRTHGSVWWNGVNVDSHLGTCRGDTTFAIAPLFHIGGLNALALRGIVRGGTMVIRRSFEPIGFLRDLVDYRVNSFFAVPAMLAALARVPGVFTADLSCLHSWPVPRCRPRLLSNTPHMASCSSRRGVLPKPRRSPLSYLPSTLSPNSARRECPCLTPTSRSSILPPGFLSGGRER
jgi:fatty-acyl-CoA synthase